MTTPNAAPTPPPAPTPERSQADLQLDVAEFAPTEANLQIHRDSNESVYGVVTGVGDGNSGEHAAQVTLDALESAFGTTDPAKYKKIITVPRNLPPTDPNAAFAGRQVEDEFPVVEFENGDAEKAMKSVFRAVQAKVAEASNAAGAPNEDRSMGAQLSMVKMFKDKQGNIRAAYGHVGTGRIFVERQVTKEYGHGADAYYQTESVLKELTVTEPFNRLTASTNHEVGLHRFGFSEILQPGDRLVISAADLVDKTLSLREQRTMLERALDHEDPNTAAEELAKLNSDVDAKAILVIDVAGSGTRGQNPNNNQGEDADDAEEHSGPTEEELEQADREQELKQIKRRYKVAKMAGKVGMKRFAPDPRKKVVLNDQEDVEQMLFPDRIHDEAEAWDQAHEIQERNELEEKTVRQQEEEKLLRKKQKHARFAGRVGLGSRVEDPFQAMLEDPQVIEAYKKDREDEDNDFNRVVNQEAAEEMAYADPDEEARLAREVAENRKNRSRRATAPVRQPIRPRRRPAARP